MLPIETREAMLVALDADTIVTGAYTIDGGICPMLAAHRRGGRTNRESFAHAWDRYTGAEKGRRASEREIRTLRCMLEASLIEPVDLYDVKRPKQDTGERNRMRELARHPRWAWSRLFRRWDTYSATIGPLEDGVAPDRSREETPVLMSDLAAEDGSRPVSTV
jgi:hypothetical protein